MYELTTLNAQNRMVNWGSAHTKNYRQLRNVEGEEDTIRLSSAKLSALKTYIQVTLY